MHRALRSPALVVAVIAIVLALGFLGTRGIWDPDEGRYTNDRSRFEFWCSFG